MIRKLGYRQDPPDNRDLPANGKLGAPTPPESASLRELVIDVLDQGGTNSCVANAGMQAVRMSQYGQSGQADVSSDIRYFPPLGSRAFGYYLSRAYHHETAQDQGTFIRTFFAALNKFGFPPERAWPFESPYDKMPSTAAFRAAFDQKSPTKYYRIVTTGGARITDIKRAIAAGFPVVFGTQVTQDFAAGKIGDDPVDPPMLAPIAGGHAMVVAGYDPDGFSVVNSWGTGWGANGWCFMSPDYLGWNQTRDLWVIESSPRFSE